MAKQIVRITENELKRIVNESVNKVLNEISSDFAFNAADAARKKRRPNQRDNFVKYAHNQIRKEIGNSDKIVEMNDKFITWMGLSGNEITLSSNGTIQGIPNCATTNLSTLLLARAVNKYKTDKQTARIIAKWASKYMVLNAIDEDVTAATDWHTWAIL